MNSDSTLILDKPSDSLIEDLSIALIGPDEERRKAASKVLAKCQGGIIREFATYPPSLNDVPKLLEQQYDVIVIDLDSRPEYALQLVENICAHGASTVMVYSMKSDSDQLVRCMRAGAREFLTLPFAEELVTEALTRVSARRSPARPPEKKASGKLMAFLGAKGGDGVTTLACNFAVSMAKESGQSTLLIDLDLPLGDAALNLGVVAEYSTINALQNAARLDSAFLSKLLVKHSSGVSVLAAPGKFPQFDASHESIDKLLDVARQDFDNVVIDMGSRLDLMSTSIFKDGSTVYLVIQAGIAGLRNSNRLISQYFATEVPRLEIVLNRFQSRTLGVSEGEITKALTRPAQWKIPNDYNAVRRMQHTAIPLALEDSPISRLIRQMARTACGLPAIPEKGSAEKNSGFSLKNLGRSFTSKLSSSEEPPVVAQPEPVPVVEDTVAPVAPAQSSVDAEPVPAAAPQPAAENQPPSPAESAQTVEAKAEDSPAASAPVQPIEAETRIYRGAAYVKGADGKWYLQKAPASAESVPAKEAEKPSTPVITWPVPAAIVFGKKLDSAELNATAPVPGSFDYIPAEGEELAVGEHTLTAYFTPEDVKGYSTAEATVSLTVTKAVPAIDWTVPAQIIYGTELDSLQLNATASVPGNFVYSPPAGEVLPAGEHTLMVFFSPTDLASYEPATATVQVSVAKATPTITWAAPVQIAYGAALGSLQLNATTSVPGNFVYSPAAREVLPAGEHTLSVSFTPLDAANYTTAEATSPLTVTKATPIVLWSAAQAIAEGTALNADQLNATALVEGSFEYTPAAGEVLTAGAHTLSVTFTPKVSGQYNSVQSSQQLTVIEAKPAVETPTPAESSVEKVSSSHDAASEPFASAPAESEAPAAPLALETPSEEAPAEAVVESEAALAVEAPAEPIVESIAEPAAEPVVEQAVEPAAEEAHAEAPVQAEVPPTVEFSAKPVAVEAPIAAPAIPAVVEAAAAPVGTHPEAPEQALVKLPPPKFTFEAGSGLNLMGTAVFPDGTTIYLVMQPGSGGQVDSQKLVSQFLSGGEFKPEIAINRYEQRSFEEGNEQAEDDLSQDVNSRRKAQLEAFKPSARPRPEKKKGFLNGLRRSLWAKVSPNEKPEQFTQLGLNSEQDTPFPYSATAQVQVSSVAFSSAAPLPAEEPGTPLPPAHVVEAQETHQEESYSAPAPPVETRTYQGATYVKGADGKWHLQQVPSRAVRRETPPVAAPVQAKQESPVADDPSPVAQSAPVQAAPVQTAPVPVVPAHAAPIASESLVLQAAPVEVAAAPVVAEEAEPQPDAPEAASEPLETPIKAQVKAPAKKAPVRVKKPASKAVVKAKKSAAKAPTKAKAKSKGKAAAKPAAKAKKAVKAPAKAAAKSKRPVKASAKPAAKATLKRGKTGKPAVKGGKTANKSLKTAVKKSAKAKKPAQAARKTGVKAKAVKSTAKPAAKKKAVKAPARKPVKRR